MKDEQMKIEFVKADISDAELLVDIYNSSFYSDYIRYGECPAYGKTKEMMEQSIIDFSKFLILCDSRPVGCIACKELGNGAYEVGCLCVVPEFQGIPAHVGDLQPRCFRDTQDSAFQQVTHRIAGIA